MAQLLGVAAGCHVVFTHSVVWKQKEININNQYREEDVVTLFGQLRLGKANDANNLYQYLNI